ncbi:hypothetical protein ACFXKG_02645 [Streptomyces sp. NPDC059255]|uniref:hypothetical protein n=1 Tax=Streptomyces sp. NPDC059255 TaxID=3346793 RepID=UPI00367B7281
MFSLFSLLRRGPGRLTAEQAHRRIRAGKAVLPDARATPARAGLPVTGDRGDAGGVIA